MCNRCECNAYDFNDYGFDRFDSDRNCRCDDYGTNALNESERVLQHNASTL